MKKQFLGLRTVVYFVPNLKEAKKWYSKIFETAPYFDEAYYVGFNIAGYELGLLPEEKPITDKTNSVVTYWGVEDINFSYDFMLKNGAIEVEKPTNVGGELMTASVKDPWGNEIGIIYNPHFKV
ncbi:MAG: hypothetical protein JXR68_10820 [Bacteroidales bacterium]|nr:hypothetical protein [Bacteroidales bacterium]